MIAHYFDQNFRVFVQSAGASQPSPGETWTYGDNYNLQIYVLSAGISLPLSSSDTIAIMLYQPITALPYQNLAIIGTPTIQTDAAGNKYYLINVNLYTTQLATLVQANNKPAQCNLHLAFSPVSGERFSSSADIPITVNPDITQSVSGSTSAPAGYPPTPAGFELVAHKNAASGYPGLSAGLMLTATQIPTDGTLTVIGGNLSVVSAGPPYFGTFSSFSIPAAGSTVNVTVSSVADKVIGQTNILTDGVNWMSGSITAIASLVVTYRNNGGTGAAVTGTMGSGHVYMGGGPQIDGVPTDFYAGDGTFKAVPAASSAVAGVAPQSPGNAATFLSGAATPTWVVPPVVAAGSAGYVPSPASAPFSTFATDASGNPGWILGISDPTRGVELRDDFLSGSYGTTPYNSYVTAGGGAGYITNAALIPATSVTAGGLALYTQNATVPSQILWAMGNTASGFEYCLPVGAGPLVWKSKLAVDVLSAVGNLYTAYAGLIRLQYTTFGGGASPWAGLYFEYDSSVSLNWQACVASGTNKSTGTTRVDTGVAVAINTWFKMQIVVNAAWTSFQYYINGVLKATITSGHIPSSSDSGLSPVYLHNRTTSAGAGNVRTFYAANFYLYYQFSQ